MEGLKYQTATPKKFRTPTKPTEPTEPTEPLNDNASGPTLGRTYAEPTNGQDTGHLVRNAEAADKAINRMGTYDPYLSSLPAPAARAVLGHMQSAATRLTPLIGLLTTGIRRSLHKYEMIEESGANPAISVATATAHLDQARKLAIELSHELLAATEALAGQRPCLRPSEPAHAQSSAAKKFFEAHGYDYMSANDRVTYTRLREGGFGSN